MRRGEHRFDGRLYCSVCGQSAMSSSGVGREVAQLQRTISTLVRERDEVIARTRAHLLMNRRRDFTG